MNSKYIKTILFTLVLGLVMSACGSSSSSSNNTQKSSTIDGIKAPNQISTVDAKE